MTTATLASRTPAPTALVHAHAHVHPHEGRHHDRSADMIEMSRKDFASAIALARMPLERRNTIPILGAVRCRANGAIEFEGTDLDVTVTASIPRHSADGWHGDLIVPEPLSIARALAIAGGDGVRFSQAERNIVVSSADLSLSGVTYPADDFPTTQVIDNAMWKASISPEIVASLARVALAMSREPTRYYLNGIFLHHVEGWNYRAVGTDGHRLSILEFALPDATGVLDGIIIPSKAISILLLASKKAAGPLSLSAGCPAPRNTASLTEQPAKPSEPTRITARFEAKDGVSGCVSTKLIDGTYPDYKRVVPHDNPRTFGFKIAELRRAVMAMSSGSSDVRAVRIALNDDGTRAALSRACPVSFSTSIEIACQHNSPGFAIGLNGNYVLDMLKACGGEEIAFATASADAPVIVRNPSDTAWTGVQMPMRV